MIFGRYTSQIISQADGKILEDILLAVDDEDAISYLEELSHEPIHRVESFRSPSMPPLQFHFKHDDEFVFHSELGIIEKDCDLG